MALRLDKRYAAEIFYNQSLPTALAGAIEYAGAKGYVASMPKLLELRLRNPSNQDLWSNWLTANSEEHIGRTAQRKEVVAEYHGGGILSLPGRIEQAYKQGLTSAHGAKLDDKEIKDLLAGKLPNGKEVPVYSFSDFIKRVRLPANYIVILDLSEAKKLESGRHSFDMLYDNPLVIVRSGGAEQAKDYLDKAKRVYKTETYGNWHPFAKVNPDNPEGRLLYLGGGGDGGFNGDCDLGGYGRFVGVRLERSAPKAHGREKSSSVKVKAPSLEQVLQKVLRVSKPFVPDNSREDYKRAISKLCK